MKKIVIIRRTGLGDFIAGTVPVCNYLIDKYKECEFFFFMSERNSYLVKYFFPEATVYVIPKGNKYIQAIKTALKYRNLKPDIGISPIPDYPKLNSLFLYLIGCKNRYGRKTKNLITSLLNNPTEIEESQIENNLVGLSTLNLVDSKIINITEKWLPKIQLNTPIKNDENINVMIEVSNNRRYSQLDVNKIAEVLNLAYKKYNFNVLITLKEADLKKARTLQTLLEMKSKIKLTKTLDEFIKYVDLADIVLCGDGGLAHISGALNKNIIALYGKTSIKKWGILGGKTTYLFDNENVNNISLKEIKNILEQKLNNLK